MKNAVEYKGFIGKVEYDADDQMLYGSVLGAKTVLSFAGKDGVELDLSFRTVVDEYLGYCAENGIQPEKTWKGKMTFRPKSDELRQKIAIRAELADVSINDWLNDVVEKAVSASDHQHPSN
ncbi:MULTISPECIES: type II toxin-antitoxin system HicB family antitoxin [Paraburkholderia]|uniref:type II toxin-antitoxin system HicB family antitoxin n=1 Tax=Paraburkholderia TaxID=1822464 RepID=UPI00224F87B9|nr:MULTISPECIES: type II toxin-antitoxin system HicB family antitoxin [Paraburkholderia]MCX4162335.1 type II toxin-antitoxin system HicB family antitoxin [Paraburkholderia megapolitana]MDN7157830.1 type II toxin-antitoxin system HicB family antitoxin [Paraburkholderia sp. CHISQ3]MDQ6494877.1 type II toxin-antitoxin system HicB family antitoxin [Paraburkholderia megapolitana]